jgi:hypothetical protein
MEEKNQIKNLLREDLYNIVIKDIENKSYDKAIFDATKFLETRLQEIK